MSYLKESFAVVNLSTIDVGKNLPCGITISSANMEQGNVDAMRDFLRFDLSKFLEEFDGAIKIADMLHDKRFKFRNQWDRLVIAFQRLREY